MELEPPGWFPFPLKDTGIPFYPVSFESDAFVLESSTIFYGHAGVAWEGLGTAVGVLHTVYFPKDIRICFYTYPGTSTKFSTKFSTSRDLIW